MSKEKKSMENFGGFNDAADIDFFGEGGSPDTVIETGKDDDANTDTEKDDDTAATKLEDNTDDEGKTPEPAAEETTEEEEEDFFGASSIEEDEETGQDTDEVTKNTDNEVPAGKNVSFLQQLKERGLADYELEEGEELTDEKAAELIEDSYEAGLEKRLGDMLGGLPPVTRDLVKFAINGGDESEFLSKVGKQPSVTQITKDMDLSDEKNQEAVIRAQLKADDHDDEYIESNIEFLKDSGKMESLSKKYHGKIIERDEKQRQKDVEKVEQQRRQMKENQRKFKSTLAEHLKSTKEINGYSFNEKDAKDLPSYIGDATIKTEDGQQISAFQKDLFEALQDKDNTLLMAKLIRNKFDFSSIANKAKTSQTRKVQEDVRRAKASKTSGSSRNSKKSIADFFND